MKMQSMAMPQLSAWVQVAEVPVLSRNLYKQQMANRLKCLANDAYQLMLKNRFLANTLKGPVFKEIIDTAEQYSDMLMESLSGYTSHIRQLENSQVTIPSLVKPCEIKFYSGWVDRVKELIHHHLEMKEQFVNIFINFKESDFPETFQFLKQQLMVHEDQLWNLRNQIEK